MFGTSGRQKTCKLASKRDPSISNEPMSRCKLYLAYFILENLPKITKTIGNVNRDDVRRKCWCARLIFACAVPLTAFTRSHFSFFASYFYQINPVIKCSSCQDRFYVPPLSDQNPCVVITNNPKRDHTHRLFPDPSCSPFLSRPGPSTGCLSTGWPWSG